jgi:hypothetical protein
MIVAIILGEYTFDAARTAVSEKQQEVGGRDGRVIRIKGIIEGPDTLDGIEAELDRILAAASEDAADTALSLRPARRLWVRRTAFTREVNKAGLTGVFTLDLEARDPFEESAEPVSAAWDIGGSGAVKTLVAEGNAETFPLISLSDPGTLHGVRITDGTRALRYPGSVAPGRVLVLDGPLRRAALDGEDITPYVEGEFPRLQPGTNTLTYTDDADSSHTASATVAWRARWW